MISLSRRAALAALLTVPILGRAHAAEAVRIGQATPALSFLPLWAARTFDTFPAAGIELTWAAIPGGDPAALAALDSGDIDLAAVGSDTAMAAIAKGQPFVMIYSLMSKMSLEVVVSTALAKRAGVSAQDPLGRRIEALKGAIFGVSAVGGTQDRTARWIAAQGRLDPKTGIQVALAGAPPAIQAALENGRIDAFALSPPESGIAEAGGYGIRLINPDADFPALKNLPNLVLVARPNPDAATAKRIRSATAALGLGAAKVLADPDDAAAKIGAKYFAKIAPSILRNAIHTLLPGLEGAGRFSPAGIEALTVFSKGSGTPVPPGEFWTNGFIG